MALSPDAVVGSCMHLRETMLVCWYQFCRQLSRLQLCQLTVQSLIKGLQEAQLETLTTQLQAGTLQMTLG